MGCGGSPYTRSHEISRHRTREQAYRYALPYPALLAYICVVPFKLEREAWCLSKDRAHRKNQVYPLKSGRHGCAHENSEELKNGLEGIQTNARFLVHAPHLPAAPEHWQGPQEGLLGVRSISAHTACPLWPITFWRMCPCRVILFPRPPQLYSWLAASCLQG